MKTLRIPTNLFVGLAVLALPLTTRAASVLFDFNSDPSTSGLLTLYGNSTWQPSGGVVGATNTTDGYLSITDAINSQRGAIVFADFDAGSVVAGFTFDADFRIGNGTAVPADGFSINYCRANDPILADVANGGNPATDGGMWACGPNCEDNLPEEGTHTGIGIGFDAWQSPQGGSPPPWCNASCQTDPSYLGPDIVGLSVRVDGNLIAQFPMPTLNGACNDPTSLQTGPRDGTGDPSILCWQHLKVVLTTNAQLSVFWKGVQLLTNYQTTYFPSPGRLVFTGRTGGANENHHVDNIAITTIPASVALVGAASGFPDGFAITINDSGSSVINTNAPITTKLNGSTVTPTSIT